MAISKPSTNQTSTHSSPGGYRPGMYPNKNRPRSGYHTNQKNRKNERIRAHEVRVIGPDGKQIGVLPTKEALEMAKRCGLDLVEVSPTARPPVCRILEFGKFMYEQSKKGKDSAKSATSKLKEIKFRINIEQHDYETKLRHAEEFLFRNNKVKLTLSMRGREMERKHLGFDVINRALADLLGMGTHDTEPKLAGRNIIVMLTPLAANKRKPKFMDISAPMKEEALEALNEADDEDEEEHDEVGTDCEKNNHKKHKKIQPIEEESGPDSIFDVL